MATAPNNASLSFSQPDDNMTTSMTLSPTLGSLAASRQQASQIAKTYRQAANLFLTRRLPEALSTIEPIITPQPADTEQRNGHVEERNDAQPVAPIALASRGSRIKVWIFIVTFLNAVVEMGAEEGKQAFGAQRWKALVAKARDGTIWDEIIKNGYGGNEGAVDADVVVNLATLLITHSPSQQFNQQKLEAYLSASQNPTFDITSHLNSPQRRGLRRTSSTTPGTNTPRDLQTRLKLLELYALHVLPRNGEWEYAREFITLSEVLDEERKEAFLHALQGLQDDQQQAALHERELQRQQQEQLEQRRRDDDARAAEAARVDAEIQRRDDLRRQRAAELARENANTIAARARSPPPPQHHRTTSGGTASKPRPGKKDLSRRPGSSSSSSQPRTLYERAALFISNLQTYILATAQNLATNPLALLRTVLFVLAVSLAFGRRDVRLRIRRALERGWGSVRRTVGAGVKVSSI